MQTEDMSEKNSVKSYFDGNTVELSMDLTISEYQKYLLRLDPTDFKGDFSIKRVTVNDGRKDVISLNGKQFRKYISGIGDAINEKPSVNREYTTLAALGVQIEGNKLGLGVNLYSGEQTLVEQYGKDYLDIELLKDSKLYRKKILYGG
ncbi:hypothetical protein DW775_00890 [Agathobacter rectalis]|uniref:Uncharacterized protein n=2 Tax=Agathobacter rectalis TaxID=39491 RepID=A0A413MC21_9FIRM|nr:hypothetical protein DXA03_06895 [Agathobacter rectalis]RHD98074.1 hypothetical protein DW775_00890 [Agathobacter rectalis]